jgi:cytosine/adenosine deaminase-related metal-dependent hydrolase
VTGHPQDAPLRDGAVAFDPLGRVLAVGTAESVLARCAGATRRHEQAILFPGLVNAHAHLELSALRGLTQSGGGFGPWVSGMMAQRARVQPERDAEAIDAGVSELLRSGTVALGEVTNTLASLEALGTAPILTRVFHEIFGMQQTAAAASVAAAKAKAASLTLPARMAYALAPHTLYSLHGSVAQAIVNEAAACGAITSLHLAEHPAERAFLRDGSGPFAAFLAARGVPATDYVAPDLSPVHYADSLDILGPALLAVHLCDASRDELALVARAGARAVLCPRSNLFIELKLPPLQDMLEVGLRPALGTDSLASNTTLDVLAEAAALRDRFPRVPPSEIFAMASWYGAVALGVASRVGALRPGLAPGLLALDVQEVPPEPFKLLLRSPPLPRRVLLRPPMPKPGDAFEAAP